MPSPRCSLIVPIHNGLHFLIPMLESLSATTEVGNYELILSDDGSDEKTIEFLRSIRHARTIYSKENKGFASTCNAGARVADGEFFVFLNTDLEFRPGWLEALVGAAEEDSGIGAVGCKLLYPDGTIQHGGVFLREDRLDRVPLIASHDHVGKPGDDAEANRECDLMAVTAAAILIRREAFEDAGGFDEEYLNGYEDVDLCLELIERGWRIVYEPKCEIVHYESKSGSKRFAHSKANQRRFLEKWQSRAKPEVLVTPNLEVGPHPGGCPEEQPSVRIIVPIEGRIAAAALTLESIFSARIGLYDSVVVVADRCDSDAENYLRLCEGFDDCFKWTFTDWWQALRDANEDFIALLTPGTVVTQGWLARLIKCASREHVAAVGPLLSEVSGVQNVMAYMAEGSTGAYFPNELSHAFARNLAGQGTEVRHLETHCVLLRASNLAEYAPCATVSELMANIAKRGDPFVVAKDVFVHREMRFVQAPTRVAA